MQTEGPHALKIQNPEPATQIPAFAGTGSQPETISVIIPTLNEAACIERTLLSVQLQEEPAEIIVVDGGSTDGTPEYAALHATVLEARRGRASQMNAGAAHATGHVLLFLHADTYLPPDALTAVRRTLADPRAEAGTFRLAFDRQTPLLRLYELAARLPWVRLCFGDRGLFVRRAAFEAAGGYPRRWPIFEDLELAARLDARGGFRFLPQAVTTSARRFCRHGALRQQLRNLRLWLHYMAGTPPRHVAHRYRYDP